MNKNILKVIYNISQIILLKNKDNYQKNISTASFALIFIAGSGSGIEACRREEPGVNKSSQ